MAKRERRAIPRFWSGSEEQMRRVVGKCLDELQRGKTNNTFDVTLTPSVTTTLLETDLIGPDSEVFLSPRTANAAAALATTWLTIATGVCTFNHASNAQTDRTFGALVVG